MDRSSLLDLPCEEPERCGRREMLESKACHSLVEIGGRDRGLQLPLPLTPFGAIHHKPHLLEDGAKPQVPISSCWLHIGRKAHLQTTLTETLALPGTNVTLAITWQI